MFSAGPYSIDEIKGTGAAVIQAGFPGQAGGQAIAETLFGVNNPGGKLTTTIYPGISEQTFECLIIVVLATG